MTETYRYEVTVEGHEDSPVSEYIREILSQLGNVSGVSRVEVERVDTEDRDISELYRIIGDLSDHELQNLEDAIDAYTEEEG